MRKHTLTLTLAALVAVSVQAAIYTWTGSGGNMDWFNVNNWYGPVQMVPDVHEEAQINAGSEVAPVVYASVVTQCVNRIVLGNAAGQSGYLWLQNGVITNSPTGTTAEFVVGNGGKGWFRMSGGELRVPRDIVLGKTATAGGTLLMEGGEARPSWGLVAGDAGTGKYVQTGGLFYITYNGAFVGKSAGGFGEMFVSNGVFQVGGTMNMFIGDNGTGIVLCESGVVRVARQTHMARGAGSEAVLWISETASYTNDWGLWVGGLGKAELYAEGFVRCGNGDEGLTIGDQEGSRGYAEFGTNTVNLGTGGSIRVGKGGYGEMVMRGTRVLSGGTAGRLRVREEEGGFGVLRGWGKFEAVQDFLLNNGLVIADGAGEDRDLALNSFIGAQGGDANKMRKTVPNPPEGTNGWYAVNGGRLLMPRVMMPNSDEAQSLNWGEPQDEPVIDLVNSFRMTAQSVTGGVNSRFDFNLLANDRADVPPAPKGMKLIGVWEGGFYRSFGALDVEIRYDHVAARSNVPQFLRWDAVAGRWEKYGTEALSGCRVKAVGLPAQIDGSRLMFALCVPEKDGTLLIVK